MNIITVVITAIIVAISCNKASYAFPSQCRWERNTDFFCKDADIKTVPKGIALSARLIDLSNNKMLEFPEDYFLRFERLEILILNNCSLNHAVRLPQSLRVIMLKNNALREEAVRKTFANKSSVIQRIDLSSNGLMLDRILNFIPRTAILLRFSYNNLPVIRRDLFSGFGDLSYLILTSCRTQQIAPGSLDPLIRLNRLYLDHNKLKSLPEKLFARNTRLVYIRLNNNRLTGVPDVRGPRLLQKLYLDSNRISNVSQYDLYKRTIARIELGYNRIESFDLRHTKYLRLDLSYNRITKLDPFAFSSVRKLKSLRLQNNRISSISPSAFSGVAEISALYLQKNQIQTLPKDVFRHMRIMTLFLYGNQIARVSGALEQMTSPPSKLLLFSNPPFKIFRPQEFTMMSNQSEIFINCSNIIHFSTRMAIRVKVECFPSASLVIPSFDYSLEKDGFTCTRGRTPHQCTPCPLGYYTGNEPCKKCPPGSFYQDEFGFNHCKVCPLGQYVLPDQAPGKGPLDCLTCPDGTKKNLSAGYRACSCIKGFARTDRFGECSKCSQAGISCERDYPMIEAGYWWIWHPRSPSNVTCKYAFKNFINNLETKDDSYSRATSSFHCKLPKSHRCPIRDSCLGGVNATCLRNYTGVLCSVCQTGYSRSWQKCVKCPPPLTAGFQVVGYIALFVIMCALVSCADKMKLEGDDQQTRTFADVLLSNFKILLGFYQVLLSIIHAFSSFHWPDSLKKAIGIFQIVQFQVFRIPSLSCIRPDWGLNVIHEFWLALGGTIGVPVIIFAYFTAKKTYLYFSIDVPQEYTKRRRICKKNCLRVLMLFLFVTYPLTSQKIFQVLPVGCHDICTVADNGNCLHYLSYMRADYSVECLPTNDITSVTAFVALIIPLGLPVILFCLLQRYARQSKDRDFSPLDNDNFDDQEEMRFALKFLFENYDASNRFWEALELIRKLILTAGVSMFIGHYKVGINATIMIAFMFAILHAFRHPIKNRFENTLQLLSLSIIPINLCLAAFLKSSIHTSYAQNGMEDLVLGYVLVALNLVVFLLVCIRLLPKIFASLRQLLKILFRFCSNLSCSCICLEYSRNSNRELLLK